MSVLDIGAGVGLLSVLAARAAAAAGLAADVYAVERDAHLAELCGATVAANRASFPRTVNIHVIRAEATDVSVAVEAAAAAAGDGARARTPTGQLERSGADRACAHGRRHGGRHGGPLGTAVLPHPIRSDPSAAVLPERVHVLVHEIFGDDALAEGLLPTLRHAVAALLAPSGVLVPSRLTFHAALATAPPCAEASAALGDEHAQVGRGLLGLLNASDCF